MIRTGLPANFYILFLKILVCVILVVFLLDNPFFAILSGVIAGLLLHISTSYYDCIVQLKGDVLTFYFIRPIFFKEVHKLSNLDYAEIIKESPDKMLKDLWWKSDNLAPLSYTKLILYKGETTYQIRFHTNQNDLLKLELGIKQFFISRKVE